MFILSKTSLCEHSLKCHSKRHLLSLFVCVSVYLIPYVSLLFNLKISTHKNAVVQICLTLWRIRLQLFATIFILFFLFNYPSPDHSCHCISHLYFFASLCSPYVQFLTKGCETSEMTLRRNGLGQLGFHVNYEGIVAEVSVSP